jgi:hypothetical protein
MNLRVIVMVASAISIGGLASAAGPNPTPGRSHPVQVTNTTSNPVPVTIPAGVAVSGGLTVNNTSANPVPVQLPSGGGNVNARQAGSWNVNVANTAAAPLYTAPALRPTPLNLNVASGQDVTVPAGKTYVIEHWHARCSVDATAMPPNAVFVASGPGFFTLEDYAVPVFVQPNGGANGITLLAWAASATIKLTLPAGSRFTIGMSTPDLKFVGLCIQTASGYSMDD